MSNGLVQQIDAYGHAIGGGWMAYGYILYYGQGWGEYRISLDQRIQPGDGEDSIDDWTRHLEAERGLGRSERL